jgi:signal transduction histidine kinase
MSEIHHFYIEMLAVILAIVLAFYYISRGQALNDKFSLFLGIGFLANALIDLLHVVVSYTFMNETLFLKYFIPQTWFAGRIFLSAMFAIAIAGYSSLSKDSAITTTNDTPSSSSSSSTSLPRRRQKIIIQKQQLPKKLVVSLVILTIISAGVALSSLFISFPGAVIDNFPLHRPYEIPPLALFLVALLYFYKNQLYKRNDAFYKGIVGSLLIDIFGQIIMSYSATSFDAAHNVSHILKDAAYFVNIIGLALSSIQYNVGLRESNKSLEESNDRLKEREELIRVQFEKLKESDKMKDEFINVAAHELRTPLQPILGLTEVLRSKTKDVQQQELLDVVIRNAKRSQRLTNDILDVTKIESKSLNLNKEQFNLNDLIKNTIIDIESNREFINKNKNNIKLLYVPQDVFIEADKVRITQVIFNLLSNAIKFTDARADLEGKSIVTIKVEKIHHNQVFVTVKDTGIGIDPEIMPRLFEKFMSKSYQGTGLGLFISKSIIEAHGGKIWAENNIDKDSKQGATFTFSLPTSKMIKTQFC